MARRPARPPLLPPDAVLALKAAALRALGALVLLGCTAVAAALVTYTPGDPSLNTASDGPVYNALGPPGALLADLLLQWGGLAVAAPVLVIALWAMRLLAGLALPPLWLRGLGVVAATLLLAIALQGITPPPDWPIPAGVGGVAGLLLRERLAIGLAVIGLEGAADLPLSLGATAAAAVVAQWAIGIGWRDVTAWAGSCLRLTATLGRGVTRLAHLRAAAPLAISAGADAGAGSDVPDTARPGTSPEARGRSGRGRPRLVARDPTPAGTGRGRSGRTPRDRGMTDEGDRRFGPDDDRPDDPAVPLRLPPLDLLAAPDPTRRHRVNEDALTQNARLLEAALADFGVKGSIVKVRPGPVVTLYELDPAPGTKTARVIGLADDIARTMSALSVRIAVVPGQSVIGIELPNSRRDIVRLRELLSAPEVTQSQGRLILALGKDIGGAPVAVDLARMPHLLIAGTTGSGKSVAVNTMILSLLYGLTPAQVRFIMIDPKMLELSIYDGIPHLLAPVVTDPRKAVAALKWAVREMENRYRAMSHFGVRNIEGYNQKLADALARGGPLTRNVQVGFDPETGAPVFEDQPIDPTPLPYIVIIVDEMADLMLVAGKEVEAVIQRLAQMARAAGLHLIMATQRPSVDVITGTIKANFPTRVSFQVTSKIDSRTILGEQGAEQLLGQGDMLYMAAGGRITRVHGPFVSDQEVETVCDFLRAQARPDYLDAVTEEDQEADARIPGLTGSGSGRGSAGAGGRGDPEAAEAETALFDAAVAVVAQHRKASTSFVQRHLKIGYNRAATLIERMEAEGMITAPNHAGKRTVLLPPPPDDEHP